MIAPSGNAPIYKSNSGELDSPGSNHPQDQNPSKKADRIDLEVREWFETEFWPLYPRREGKQPALKAAGAKATNSEKRAFYIGRLKAQLPGYLLRKAESGQRVIPMAATWFNQDRADDDLELPRATANRGAVQDDYPEYIPLSRVAI